MQETNKGLNEEVARLKEMMGINEEADRCLRIARRKYDKPSAYRSGAIVRCRQGKIWKDLKEAGELEEMQLHEDEKLIAMAHSAITRRKGKDYAPDVHELQAWIDEYLSKQKNEEKKPELMPGKTQFAKDLKDDPDFLAYKKNAEYFDDYGQNRSFGTARADSNDPFINKKKHSRVNLDDLEIGDEVDEAKKTDFSKEKKSGLHGWFSRRGGDGNKGWVDCNTCRTVDGRKKCKACGREKGEKRSKYPSCRPTPASCGTPGKGKKWGKTKNEGISLNEDTSVKRVALLFIVVDNKVLLFKRSPKETTNASKYGMLGGGIEKGESPQNAIKREVKEEAGVTLTSFKPLKKYKYDGVELNVFYTNTFPIDKIKLDKKEHTSHKLFSLEDVMEMADKEMIQSNKKIARDYNKKVSNKKQLQENLNEEITKIKKMMGLNEEPEVITWGDVSKLLSTIKDNQNKASAMTALKGFGKLGASLLPGIDFISNAVEVIGNLGDTAETAKALMGISKNVSQNTLKSPNDSKLKQLTGPFWDALKLTPELSSMLDDKIETDFINQVIVPKISSGGNENEPLPNMDVELGKWLNSRGLRDKSEVFFTGKSGNINEETFLGNHIWQHIVDITPNEDDIPWGFKNQIRNAQFDVDNNFDLESLLNTDPDFKEYYESGDERYGEDDDMDESDLYHDIVVVDGELLDGYSRAATLLRNGETRSSAFVGTNKK
jgi:8-oxo-dGTP pyrophosphatase MutT (NUDIX family)